MGTFLWKPVKTKETILTTVLCPSLSIVSAIKELLKQSLCHLVNDRMDGWVNKWIYTHPASQRQWKDMNESVVKLVHNTHSLNNCLLSEYMYFAPFTTKVALSLSKQRSITIFSICSTCTQDIYTAWTSIEHHTHGLGLWVRMPSVPPEQKSSLRKVT